MISGIGADRWWLGQSLSDAPVTQRGGASIRLCPSRRFMVILAIVVSILAAAPARAVEPPRLADWLDAEVGLCLQFDNLADQWTKFAAGSLHARVRRFPPLAHWIDQQRPKLAAVSRELQRRTGATAKELGAGLLGRQVLVAVWPPADPVADKPAALLLMESADRQLLKRSLDKLVAARRQAGRWRGNRSLEIEGETFSIDAVVPDDEQSEFFITSADNVAILATSEQLISAVLKRRAAVDESASSLTSSTAYVAAQDVLAEDCAVRLFINPSAWNDALQSDLERKKAGSEEARSQAALVAAWRATEYVAAGVQLTPQTTVELAWKWRADALPEPVREVAASLVGHSRFVDRIPADALLACAGHIDVGRLVRTAIAGKERKAASTSGGEAAGAAGAKIETENILLRALSAGFGPDWGAFVTPAPREAAGKPASLPIELVLGIQTRPLEPANKRPALARTIEPLLHALLSAAVEAANRQAGANIASITSADDGNSSFTSVSGMVPGRPDQELAYCVDPQDRFWFGTSAACLKRASSSAIDDNPIRPSAVKLGTLLKGNAPSGLLYVDLAGWRKLATQRIDALDVLWEGKRLDVQTKERQRQKLIAGFQLADRLVAVSHIEESTVHLALTVSAEGP
jgi:hypothetical protein